MQIVVIGGAGVLGQALLRALVESSGLTGRDGQRVPVQRVISVDRQQPQKLFVDDRVEYVREGPGTPRLLGAVMGTATASLFHVWDGASASMPPGEALAATLALVDSVRDVIYHCAAQRSVPRVVLASSYAARGGAAAGPLDSEGRRLRIAELLLADASRAGRVDGRGLRLPPMAPAPGRAHFAGALLSSLAGGTAADSPVAVDSAWCLTSPAAAAAALIAAHELPLAPDPVAELSSAPARSVSVAALARAAGASLGRPLGLMGERIDPAVQAALIEAPCAPPGEVNFRPDGPFAPPPSIEELARALAGG